MLLRLRTWLGELQAFSESLRGVVPCPTYAPPASAEEARRRGLAPPVEKGPDSPEVVGLGPPLKPEHHPLGTLSLLGQREE